MTTSKNEWTNEVRYDDTEILTQQQQLKLKNMLHRVWFQSGQLHLRVTNDITTGGKANIVKPKIDAKINEIKQLIAQIEDEILSIE